MTKTSEAPLAGVNLFCTTNDHYAAAETARQQGKAYAGDLLEYAEAQTMVRQRAEGYGATLVASNDPIPADMGVHNYRIDPPKQFRQVMAQFYTNNSSLDVAAPRLGVERYGEMDELAVDQLAARLDAGEQYVFAYTGRDRGLAKYLIHNSDQLAKLEALRHKSSVDFSRFFEVRPFIETPSDRYTSYRTLVTPSGETIAASLLYSAHAKYEDSRVTEDRPWDDDDVLKTFRRELEDPTSKYFLNAIDVRSNVATGGTLIPLMGDSGHKPTPLERDILEAHDIDPDNVRVPSSIESTSRVIGKLLGPQIGIVMGLDFISSKKMKTEHMLEANAGPGAGTYRRCWGERQASSFKAMWSHAFSSLAADIDRNP